ncbi:MAG: hypothetical protein ACXADH_13550 [Candidatus Kariarchaeaceae archaeon]|jgi:hypothetical protein
MFRKVENKGRYKTAQGYYWHIRDRDIDYLFTDSALHEAEKRARKNQEDVPDDIELEPDPDRFYYGMILGLLTGAACVIGAYAACYFLGYV